MFDDIDIIAEIVLNGQRVLHCENMFIPNAQQFSEHEGVVHEQPFNVDCIVGRISCMLPLVR